MKYSDNSADIKQRLEKASKAAGQSREAGLEELGQTGVALLKVGTPVITARLRNSMSYTRDSKVVAPLNPKNSIDKLSAISDKDKLVIGTNVEYAPSVEFKSNTGSRFFMYYAYVQLKNLANGIMKNVHKKGGF